MEEICYVQTRDVKFNSCWIAEFTVALSHFWVDETNTDQEQDVKYHKTGCLPVVVSIFAIGVQTALFPTA